MISWWDVTAKKVPITALLGPDVETETGQTSRH